MLELRGTGDDTTDNIVADVTGASKSECVESTAGTFNLSINADQPYTITIMDYR